MNLKALFQRLSIKDNTPLQQSIYQITDGIAIDKNRGVVKYLDEPADSQSKVDLSVENNPHEPEVRNLKVEIETNNGVEIRIIPVTFYSIFRRFRDEDERVKESDANPLIYALKNERGWSISRSDRNKIMAILKKVAVKFKREFNGNVTIVMPSSKGLNDAFAKCMQEVAPNTKLITKMLSKRKAMEIYENVEKIGKSPFQEYYKNKKGGVDEALQRLFDLCDDMSKRGEGNFTFHDIPSTGGMRDLITKTLMYTDRSFAQYAEAINGKDILLLDDSLYHGNTIRDAVELIESVFKPKSYTALTMFSRAY